jgi:DNA-binding transcriptional regulator/RsmH inhibitor MraZ
MNTVQGKENTMTTEYEWEKRFKELEQLTCNKAKDDAFIELFTKMIFEVQVLGETRFDLAIRLKAAMDRQTAYVFGQKKYDEKLN